MPVGGGGLTGTPGGLTWTLQADFSGTAFGGTPTWTDITAYWMSSSTDPGGSPASIPWGRQDQASTVEGATTSFVLNNADGRFTPGRTSSPYYPNVRRHVRMRLTCTDGTTTETVVDGLVDTWDVTSQVDGPTLSTAAISDPFARLSASTTLRVMAVEEAAVGASSLYPLDEAAGATSASDATGKNPAAVVATSPYGAGTLTFGVTSTVLGIVSGVSLTSPDVGSATTTARGSYISVPNALPATGAAGWGISVWVLTPSSAPANPETVFFLAGTTTAPSSHIYLNIDSTGLLRYGAGLSGGGTLGGNNSVKNICDGAWHHVALSLNAAQTTLSLYIDGVLDSSPTVGSSIGWVNGNEPIALGMTVDPSAGQFPIWAFGGSLALFGQYPTALSTVRVTDPYNAAASTLAGESTSARWARLLTYRPNIGGATTGTVGAVGGEDTAGQSLGDALTGVATAEGGVVDVSRGTLRLIGRSGFRNPAPVATLDAALGQVDLPTTWRADSQSFLNDVSVSRPDGATQRATSQTSITADGSSQTSVTANVNSDRDAADMAGWMVAVGTQEATTSPTLTVNLYTRADPALSLAVLGLKTYDVVQLINLPASAPASTLNLQVQGGTLTVGASECSVQLFTTAVPPKTLRFDATATSYNQLDSGLVFAW